MRAVLEVEAGAVHPVHAENNSYLLGQEERSLPEHSHPSMDPNLRHPDKRVSGKNIHEEVVVALREELDSDEEFGNEEIGLWLGREARRLLMKDRWHHHVRKRIFSPGVVHR